MSRPSLSLTMIVKNEIRHLPRIFSECSGCFDEAVIVDTGSTDGTLDFLQAKEARESLGCNVRIVHFKWIDDFSAARNAGLEQIKTDFAFWLDGDDSLFNKEAFLKWRDTAMEFADLWIAPYHYAIDDKGEPIISFARERAFKMKDQPRFQYFIHEGIVPKPEWRSSLINTWAVKHMRTSEETRADRSRNIRILEERKHELDSRLMFYYGKELYESKHYDKAVSALLDAVTAKDIQPHDRILGFQYAAYSAMSWAETLMPQYRPEKYAYAINFASQGLQLDYNRAEFHCIIGDSYASLGELHKAIPAYHAAKNCFFQSNNSPGAIFNFATCYNEHPGLGIARCLFNMGRLDEAELEARWLVDSFKNQEASKMIAEIERIRPLVTLSGPKEETDDIVITTTPQNAYEFDSDLYTKKGMGGSETACIEMAKLLKQTTGRPVKVFNMRERDLVSEDGVEWISNKHLNEYMSKFKPRLHVAWRHNIKLTDAPTYLWCHDLYTPGAENHSNYVKHMCLTPFHKSYVQAMQGIPEEKIWVTRNGISPAKFKISKLEKNPNKVVWMSSPDRGLDMCMSVCDQLVKEFPKLELHVYYGIENLHKYGLAELANRLSNMMSERPYVKYHGFTEQSKMYHDVSDAVMWLHPCDFIETSCITALEMLALGIYPVTRSLGGLKDTLAEAQSKGQAILLPHICKTPEEIKAYVEAARLVLHERKWQDVSIDIDKFSWAAVAKEWIKEMGL